MGTMPEQQSAPEARPVEISPAPPPAIELADYSTVSFENPHGAFAAPPTTRTLPRQEARRTPWAPRMATGLIDELSEVGPRLEATFEREDVRVSLPQPATADGYAVAALEPRFLVRTAGQPDRARTLRDALSSAASDDDAPLDDLVRLELTRLVAVALDGLHRVDTVLASVDLDTFAFSLTGRPAVTLIEPGNIRRLGGEFLSHQAESRGLDDDRADFADLLAVLLSDGAGEIPDDVPGLSASDSRRLQALADRAAGRPGTRPPVSEWLAVLGR